MFSKFLRRISVAVIGVIFCWGHSVECRFVQKRSHPVPGNLKFSNRTGPSRDAADSGLCAGRECE